MVNELKKLDALPPLPLSLQQHTHCIHTYSVGSLMGSKLTSFTPSSDMNPAFWGSFLSFFFHIDFLLLDRMGFVVYTHD